MSQQRERHNLRDFNLSGRKDHAPSPIKQPYHNFLMSMRTHPFDSYLIINTERKDKCECWYDGICREWCNGITKDGRVLWQSLRASNNHDCKCFSCACCS